MCSREGLAVKSPSGVLVVLRITYKVVYVAMGQILTGYHRGSRARQVTTVATVVAAEQDK